MRLLSAAMVLMRRLMADESHATEQVAQSFNVVEVPTFIFMRNGREVARHVGSSRGDLIGKILQVGFLVQLSLHTALL